ncbi:MAG: hypothetical protein LBV02_04475 [Bacteroidales bacterium]|jgi:hypothetical protein|nr:hypothetical protein [Bacteroidales bacterium]
MSQYIVFYGIKTNKSKHFVQDELCAVEQDIFNIAKQKSGLLLKIMCFYTKKMEKQNAADIKSINLLTEMAA